MLGLTYFDLIESNVKHLTDFSEILGVAIGPGYEVSHIWGGRHAVFHFRFLSIVLLNLVMGLDI